jgi:class 3 adenylate cyclase/tetratricopeptide (TPR) repeat protein
MRCASCGTENRAGRAFCVECGTALAAACPSCGGPVEPGEKFCGACGEPLVPGAGRPGIPPARPAATDTQPPVAERRLVTVLFADLVGYTTLAEGKDPEAARELLSRFNDAARGTIERYGGTVEKFIGDAVMAVWGTPVAQEDDAERAVRAALDLLPAVAALAHGLQARAGILTGETAVNIGAIGEGMVVGDVVNTAARLQSAAPAGGVLVGEATMRAASSAIAFEPVGDQDLKGKAAPVAAWRPLRVIAQRGGQGRPDLPEPPFVGRDEEIRVLKDLIDTTGRDRRTRLVTISGPGGIGKSRLAWELEKYADGIVETLYWHRGRSPAYGDGITFWALGEMVRRRAGLAEHDDEPTTRLRIAETVADHVADEEERRFVEPALLALLGLEPGPSGGRDALFGAWRVFFERVAERGTTVLLFEDLQWADTGLLDFIDHLLEWSRGLPLLVVALTRPELFERRPEWGTQIRNATSLALEPLTADQMRTLLAGFVPGLPTTALDTIVQRADGIPLYAVETVRALLAEGRLERVGETYRPSGDLSTISVPETLRSLIASRLDALGPADRALVQDAAVLGHSFAPAALAAVAGSDVASLEARLRSLVRRELLDIRTDPRSPERGQYQFVQSLIREVAYGTLARRDRRARHLAAARYFESLGDDELAGALATHYVAAYEASEPGPAQDAVAVQARIALSAAAERASTLGAHEQAMQQLQQALAVTTEDADRVELLIRAARAADSSGRSALGIPMVIEAASIARGQGDFLAEGRAESMLGVLHIDLGQHEEAAAALETARDTLPPDEQGEARAELLATLSRAYMRLDRTDEAVATADAALAISEPAGLDRITAEALQNKAGSLARSGRRHESIALMQAAIDLARAGGYLQAELRATSNLASVVSLSDMPRAHAAIVSAVALGRRAGHWPSVSWALVFDAWQRYLMGRGWDELIPELEEALARAPSALDELRLLQALLSFQLARGEVSETRMARAAELARGLSEAFTTALYRWTVAERFMAQGHLAEAARAYADAAIPGLKYPLGLSTSAALAIGDLDRIRENARLLDEDPEVQIDARAQQLATHAAIDALEGRRAEAMAGYREAMRLARNNAADFELALLAIDAATALGADEPELARALEQARETFTRVHALPFLARLDAATSARPAARSGSSVAAGVDAPQRV